MHQFNSSIKTLKFSQLLKLADITPAYKKVKMIKKKTIGNYFEQFVKNFQKFYF